MSELQRRRGSSLLPRLRLPHRMCVSGEEIDFAFATRSTLELIVRHWAFVEQVNLDPVIDVLQGFEEGEEPCYISHMVRVVVVKASEMEEKLRPAAEMIASCHSNPRDYHQALTRFLADHLASSAKTSGVRMDRQQVIALFALCSFVTYQCLKIGRCDAFRHFLPWSTEFIADTSEVSAWVKSRGGVARAFETKTPHCGVGTLGLIASFVVLTTLLVVVHRRGGS